jgi:uncharacterized protein (DUF1330 family)
VRDYVANVTGMVERHGGRYLARSRRIERIEGEREPARVCVLIEWPSRETAVACYESEEYRPFLESRKAGARSDFFLIAGEDVNGLARIVE